LPLWILVLFLFSVVVFVVIGGDVGVGVDVHKTEEWGLNVDTNSYP
jgi:hypothetical protein